MFNDKQKEKFMSYYADLKAGKSSMIDRASYALKRISKYEEEWYCDIYAQTDKDKLQLAFDDIRGKSSSYSSGQISVLREYCKWAYQNGLATGEPLFLSIKSPSNNKMDASTVASPLELQKHLNAVFDRESKETLHNVYRAFFWLAYIGFTESQAFCILNSEIDLSAKTILHDGLLFDIYQEGLAALQNCKLLKSFYVDNPKYPDDKKMQKRIDSNYLLRGLRKNPGKHINTECSRMQTHAMRDGKITKQLSYKSVWQSGAFYWVLRQEQMDGVDPDFSGYAMRQWLENRLKQSKGLETEFDPDNANHVRYVHVIERGLIHDYNIWKQTYYS